MKPIIVMTCAAALAISGCATTQTSTGERYQQSETGAQMSSRNCRVTQARYVELVDDRREADQRAQAGQIAGAVMGGVIGGALGRNIGSGSGRTVATTLGTVGGGLTGMAAASQIDQSQRRQLGVEYTVQVDGSEAVIVQNIDPQAEPVQPGARCRVVGSGNNVRVQRA